MQIRHPDSLMRTLGENRTNENLLRFRRGIIIVSIILKLALFRFSIVQLIIVNVGAIIVYAQKSRDRTFCEKLFGCTIN